MPLSPVQTSSVTAALRELASVAGCWTASRAPTIKSGWTTSTKSVSGTAVPRRTERTRWIRCRSSHLDIWWRRSTCCRRFQTSSSTASPARMLPESGPLGRSLYCCRLRFGVAATLRPTTRSEEHTSELQSLTNLVCRLLLEKKKQSNRAPPRPVTEHYTASDRAARRTVRQGRRDRPPHCSGDTEWCAPLGRRTERS